MIIPLAELDAEAREQLAALTLEAAREHSPGWLRDLEAAREQIVGVVPDAEAPGQPSIPLARRL